MRGDPYVGTAQGSEQLEWSFVRRLRTKYSSRGLTLTEEECVSPGLDAAKTHTSTGVYGERVRFVRRAQSKGCSHLWLKQPTAVVIAVAKKAQPAILGW